MSKAKAKTPRVFVPLYKVDEEQRLVHGRITAEELDQSGEVMDYDASKPNFEKWSGDIHAASGGLSKGNVRVMHGLSVAGKLTDLEFNDNDKSIEVCAKIVDDGEWDKVLEGCYTGFSVGGKYGKRWNEVVDGQTVKKFEAVPNEVSLVDNPCVKSATFSLVKADGAEEQLSFLNPGDQVEDKNEDTEGAAPEEKVEKTETTAPVGTEPTNADVATLATELAKAANNGTTWVDHIGPAREQLLAKAAPKEEPKDDAAGEDQAQAPGEGNEAPAAAEEEQVAKTTPAGVKQVWTTSDGTPFEKKADAEAHELSLQKAAEPKTEAEKLRERLNKAISPAEPEAVAGVMDDMDRLAKAVDALSTPMEDGQPKLEKGMYTVNRFSNVLADMASLSRSIKRESVKEGDDGSDSTISADIIAAVKTLGASFITYATEQVTELLAGMDDNVLVECYDYYYAAAKEDGENQLAKDVCSLIEENKDSSRDKREEISESLVKAYGIVLGSEEQTISDDLSPPMQKRFDALEAENTELRKVADEAVSAVETLTKRVEAVENQPQPRAPNPAALALRAGDDGSVEVLGKRFSNQEDLRAGLHDLIKTMSPEQLAMEMIKASHAGGGQQLTLRS